MKHGQIIIVVFSLLVLGSLVFLETRLNVLQPPKQETFVAMNHPNDFQNEDEGTFSMNINIGYDTLEHHFGFIPDNLIIFNSKKIQGLRLLYNLEDKIMTGGLPSLKSSAFELFDKQNHNIIYTFKKYRQQISLTIKQCFHSPGVGNSISRHKMSKSVTKWCCPLLAKQPFHYLNNI